MYRGVFVLFSVLVSNCYAIPLEKIVEVPEGHTVQISCESKDRNHTFAFWELASRDILGPGNEYDEEKYEYNVLNGTLYVRNISPSDEGTYTCFSKDLSQLNKLNGRSIRMIVMKDWSQHQDANTVSIMGIVLLIGCIVILTGGSYLFYKKWSREHRLQNLLMVAIDLIVQHIKEFLANRQKTEKNVTQPDTSPLSNQSARWINPGEGSLKRPH